MTFPSKLKKRIRHNKMSETQEKRRILNFVLSNSIWKDGHLLPNYRQPFDILAETNIAYQNKKAVFPAENGDFEIWLPSTDSNRGLDG